MTVMAYGMGFGGGAAGLLWSIGGMLVVVGTIIVVGWAIAHFVSPDAASGASGASGTSGASAEPLELLRSRFARGEINEAEFSQAKRVLGYER